MRRSQAGAAGQPSSIASSKGPAPAPDVGERFHSGPAIARMTSAAIAIRSASRGHGVLAGVASLALRPMSRRSGGNTAWRGRGGVTLRKI